MPVLRLLEVRVMTMRINFREVFARMQPAAAGGGGGRGGGPRVKINSSPRERGSGGGKMHPVGLAILGGTAAYGAYRAGKYLHGKYKQWRAKESLREGIGSAIKRVGSTLWRHKGDIAATGIGALVGAAQRARATDPQVRQRVSKWNSFVDRSEASGRRNTYENRTKSSADRLRRVDLKLDADIARGIRVSRAKNTLAGAAVGYATKKLVGLAGRTALRAGKWAKRKVFGESQLLELMNYPSLVKKSKGEAANAGALSRNMGGHPTSTWAKRKTALDAKADRYNKLTPKIQARQKRETARTMGAVNANVSQMRNTFNAKLSGQKPPTPGSGPGPAPKSGPSWNKFTPLGKAAAIGMGGAALYGGAKLAGMAYRGAKRVGQSAYNYMLARESCGGRTNFREAQLLEMIKTNVIAKPAPSSFFGRAKTKLRRLISPTVYEQFEDTLRNATAASRDQRRYRDRGVSVGRYSLRRDDNRRAAADADIARRGDLAGQHMLRPRGRNTRAYTMMRRS